MDIDKELEAIFDDPLLKMSKEEATMQIDSLIWVIRQGPPTSWNEAWHRPDTTKIPYLQ